jgi:hypothetical protein
MSILQKRSLVAGVLPTTASLLAGELGINVPDGRVFLRKSGSGSDTIQSAITTGAQNSGSVVLSGSLSLQAASGSSGNVLSVAGDTMEFSGDRMELTGSFGVSGSMNLTGSLSVASDTLEFNGDLMEFTGSFVNSGSLRVIGTSAFTGSVQLSGSMVVSGSLTVAGNIFGSVATSSLALTASSADSFLVRSSLTSSLLFVTGSSRLGNIITDTHNVTGSLNVSGSVNVFNNEFIVQPTGVKLGNIITDAHTITGSFSVSGSINIDGGTY